MAFGTPVAGAVAYSASGGTTVAPAYPTGITASNSLILIVGQKPSVANSGTATTPTGWTLLEQSFWDIYGTTLGADVGNVTLYAYRKNTVAGTETGTVTVTLGNNNVAWALIIRVPSSVGTVSFGSERGNIFYAPTANVETGGLTGGTGSTWMYPRTGDLLLCALCIPTDVTTPSQFTNSRVGCSDVVMGTSTELIEPDSSTGNDIGGVVAWHTVTSGNGYGFGSGFYTTATGTTTNVRGPWVAIRIREAPAPEVVLNADTPDGKIYNNFYGSKFPSSGGFPRVAFSKQISPPKITNTNNVQQPTLGQSGSPQTLTQTTKHTNTSVIYGPALTKSNALRPTAYDNSNTISTPTVLSKSTLLPSILVNTSAIYPLTVRNKNLLLPTKVTNTNTFYTATVTAPGGTQSLLPPHYTNVSIVRSPIVSSAYKLYPGTYTNNNYFYDLTVVNRTTLRPDIYINSNNIRSVVVRNLNTVIPPRVVNVNTFYAPVVRPVWTLAPTRYVNTSVLYAPTVGRAIRPSILTNTNTVYTPALTKRTTLLPTKYNNANSFYAPLVTSGWAVVPPKYTNVSTIYAPTLTVPTWIITPPRIANENTFYAVTVRSVRTLAPPKISNTSTVYSPAITRGAVNLAPSLYTNTNTFPAASILGAVSLQPPLIASTNQLYQATLRATNTVNPPKLDSQNVIHAVTATSIYKLTIGPYVDDGYVDAGYIGLNLQNVNQFFAAKLSHGLTAQRYINQATFFAHVLRANYTLRPGLLSNTNQIYNPAATLGSAFIRPDVFVNQATFYAPLMHGGVATIVPQRYDNQQTFYPLVLTAPGVASQGSMIMMF